MSREPFQTLADCYTAAALTKHVRLVQAVQEACPHTGSLVLTPKTLAGVFTTILQVSSTPA